MASTIRRHRTNPNIWPGFVDAMATLLIILIFVLMVFTLERFSLNELLTGRNEAMNRLNRQIAELSEMLSLERATNKNLRLDLGQLSAQLQSSITERDRLSGQLAESASERDRLASRLSELLPEREALKTQMAALSSERDKLRAALADAFKTVEVDKAKITAQLAELESLRRDIAALRTVREALEAKVTKMAATLKEDEAALTASRDRTKELEARLSTEQERTALAQRTIKEEEVRLAALINRIEKTAGELSAERELSKEAGVRVERLNRQIAALRQQLARIITALEAAESKASAQRIQIASLGNRLNAALASKVAELARYRSEFFGKLREVLGARKGIRIVGDRFVFQSEVLFASGAADLAAGGRAEIKSLALTLRDIAARIPEDIDWVLRVDGHTDSVPINTPVFPSNWELSTGRAISVVKYLIDLGLPPNRLAATGFGEHQPIDKGDDEIARRRNRRIEFKLTGR